MLVDEIATDMQMGKQTELILLDFSKAFDKVAQSQETDFKTTLLRNSGQNIKLG